RGGARLRAARARACVHRRDARAAATRACAGERAVTRMPTAGSVLRAAATLVAFALIVVPILIVVLAAFSPSDYFQFPPPGLSMRWFIEFFRLDNMRSAFALSVELALASATIATILGTLAALALARRGGMLANILQSLF